MPSLKAKPGSGCAVETKVIGQYSRQHSDWHVQCGPNYANRGQCRTMARRISIVTLGVKDLATSKRFYADGLGWKPAFENNEIIFFQTGGMIFALFLRESLQTTESVRSRRTLEALLESRA
jgi:hypothetical protein